MNLLDSGLVYGFILAINDLFSMGITKEVILGNFASNWLVVSCILYGGQMILFYYGLKITSMSTLNLSWNLFSNIIITTLGLLYFKEKLSHSEAYGIGFGLISLFLFGYSQYQK
jgi:uncharacterized membrane protein